MTKKELIEEFSLLDDFESKAAASRALDYLIELVTKEVSAGGTVDVSGFGKFVAATQAGREGVNALTGKPYKTEAKQVVKFKPAAKLKRSVSGE